MRVRMLAWIAILGAFSGCGNPVGVRTESIEPVLRLDVSADAASPSSPVAIHVTAEVGPAPVIIVDGCPSPIRVRVRDSVGREVFFGQSWLLGCPAKEREARSESLEWEGEFTGRFFTVDSGPGGPNYSAPPGEYSIVATLRYVDPATGSPHHLESARVVV